MTKPTVLVVKPLMADLAQELAALYNVVELFRATDQAALLREIGREVEVIATSAWGPVRKDLLDHLPRLKYVASFGVGYDHLDLTEMRKRGILVSNTPDVLNDAVADTALALILACARRICEADRFVRAGQWGKSTFPLGYDLRGKTVGIVGLGRIGRAVADRALAFGLKVHYHGPRKKPDVSFTYHETLHSLAKASDFLVLTLPGDAANEKLVDQEILEGLGPEGTLINVARGNVVDEDALIAALKSKTIRAAGLDVVQNEPNPRPELLGLDGLVLLPHIASGTFETRAAMKDLVMANLEAYFDHRPLITPV